ncbi:MAG: YjbH domain-containing protein [Melioribacteraceae bacterium]
MKFYSHIYKLLVILFLFSFSESIATNKNDIISKLSENGFENIKVKIEDSKILIAYENRVFRFEVDALKEVLKLVVPLIDDREELILIPLNRKIPIIKFFSSLKNCREFLANNINAEQFVNDADIRMDVDKDFKLLVDESEFNTTDFRFDLVIKPQMSFEFGPYSDPVLAQINLAPDIRTSFWRGMKFSYETIFPLWNEFGTRGDSIRTGMVTLNQTFRLPNAFFISATAGIFSGNRYGFDFETKKYFGNGNFSLGGNFGVTSYIDFSGMTRILYSTEFMVTGSVNAEYRIEKYDLTLGAGIGHYLHKDNSIRVDINREFGEIEIGFFALRSFKGVSNGGFTLTVPLFPSQYWNPSFVRLKVAENYSWSYVVKSNTNDLIGLRYNTGSRINTYLEKLNPSFIKNRFSKIN